MARASIIGSEKVLKISDQAALLYERVRLIADDFGLLDISATSLCVRAVPGRQSFTLERIESCCAEMIRVGLLRDYNVDGKHYAAITRWDQTRWAKEPKLPLPPWGTEHITGGYIAPRARDIPPEAAKPPAKPRTNGQHAPAPDNGFDAFYGPYPRHVARAAALKAWRSLAPDDALQARILAAVATQKRSADWTKENGKYIPHPATWLNARRWEDETAPARRDGIYLDENGRERNPDGSLRPAV